MAAWVNLDDCIEISVGEMRFYPIELLGDVYQDVAPIIHAHWGRYNVTAQFYCSNCLDLWQGDIDLEPFDDHFYYCPNCGAKMDEEVFGCTSSK